MKINDELLKQFNAFKEFEIDTSKIYGGLPETKSNPQTTDTWTTPQGEPGHADSDSIYDED